MISRKYKAEQSKNGKGLVRKLPCHAYWGLITITFVNSWRTSNLHVHNIQVTFYIHH